MNATEHLEARSAIEALRAGVPNRAAIRQLVATESPLVQRFRTRLAEAREGIREGRSADGIVITGAFGAGKSHQLGYLAEVAQRENFIVSLLPVSKETPLFDPAKLFAAAVRTAMVPAVNDDVMTAAMHRLGQRHDGYDDLEVWTSDEVREGRLGALFAALLWLIPKKGIDPDHLARIARFFGGAKLGVSEIRGWLREAGASKLFPLSTVRAWDLALQRLRFAPRLFNAAGLAGWCILLDEVELIGRYSALQRGRSYAELARWLGMDAESSIPGILTVAAITEDFGSEMFDQKGDGEKIPPLLKERGLVGQSRSATKAIARMKREDYRLAAPDEHLLREALDKIRLLYRDAYEWNPPTPELASPQATRFMRQYVKSWITAWDMQRLYGQKSEVKIGSVASDYTESGSLERSPDADEAEG